MNTSVILFGLVMVFFAYRGYKNGFLKSLSRVLSLIAGYVASILYTEQVAAILTSRFQLEGIISFIAGALILFFGAAAAVIIAFWMISQLAEEEESRSTASSVGGMFIGSIVGLIVAIVSVWSFTFVRDFQSDPGAATLAHTDNNQVEKFASQAIGKATSTAMSLGSVDPEISRLSASLIEQPARVSQLIQRLMNSAELEALLADPQTQTILASGDVYALQQLPALQQLLQNPDFLELAESSGMLTETGTTNVSADILVANRMTEIWGRMEAVKNDARVQEILHDPAFRQQVMSGNPLDILTNPQLLELANIIFSRPSSPGNLNETTGTENTAQPRSVVKQQATSEKASKIYSWTDENGQIHISDIKPES